MKCGCAMPGEMNMGSMYMGSLDDPYDIPASNYALGASKIASIQSALTAYGVNAGGVDGLWGPNTQNALVSFQQRAGIAIDGIYGPETDSALFGSSPAPDPTPPSNQDPNTPSGPLSSPGGSSSGSSNGMSSTTVMALGALAVIAGGALFLGKKKS